ncbi:MAG: D-Ala-D-Ala carboxypeptidase family metallohydrolase [Egibacteraceae bacterium]
MTPTEFADLARVYRGLTRSSITSAGRTAQHNEDVGGVKYSAHQVDLAADVQYDEQLDEEYCRQLASRLHLRLVREGDHDHLEPLDWRRGP